MDLDLEYFTIEAMFEAEGLYRLTKCDSLSEQL